MSFLLQLDEQYVLNHYVKFLVRWNVDPRHDFGQYNPDGLRERNCEAWRFPASDSVRISYEDPVQCIEP